MEEKFVNRQEFEKLEKKVNDIEKTMNDNFDLLTKIDKKVDLINEKIISSDKIEDLKLEPLDTRVKRVEENQSWLWRTTGATILGIIIKIVFDVSKII
jgi:t-SNARE complex subunit (syntaxin)